MNRRDFASKLLNGVVAVSAAPSILEPPIKPPRNEEWMVVLDKNIDYCYSPGAKFIEIPITFYYDETP